MQAQITFVLPPGVYYANESFCQDVVAGQIESGQMIFTALSEDCVFTLNDTNGKIRNVTVGPTHPLQTF